MKLISAHQLMNNLTNYYYQIIKIASSVTSRINLAGKKLFLSETLKNILKIPNIILASIFITFAAPTHAQNLVNEPLFWLEYIASHTDLMNAFGGDWQQGKSHYLNHGERENRTESFSACNYIAANPDLITYLGTNYIGGAQHYISYGRFEGRTATFDADKYATANPDLRLTLNEGTDLCDQYIRYGRNEGRKTSPSEVLLVGLANKCLDSSDAAAGRALILNECVQSYEPKQLWNLKDNGQIASAKDSNVCITTDYFKLDNSTRVLTWHCNSNHPTQRWVVKDGGRIANATNTNKCIDVSGAQSGNGSPIIIYDCHDNPNQKWAVTTGRRLVGFANKCLDAGSATEATGTAVAIWNCQNGAYAPQFQWKMNEKSQIVGIGGNNCITPVNFNLDNGRPLIMWPCSHQNPTQQWILQTNGEIASVVNPRKCIDVSGFQSGNGTPVHVWDCHGGSNQKWATANGLSFVGWPNKCFNAHTTTAQRADVNLWDCVGVPQQEWVFAGDRVKGIGGLCLSLKGTPSSWGDRTPLEINSCIVEDSLNSESPYSSGQNWYQKVDGSIASRDVPGFCADVLSWQSGNGSTIGLSRCNGLANQLWAKR